MTPLAALFGAAARRRRRRALSEPLPVPVVVVGNISVGGTGKTPLLIALVSALRERGHNPGVIARGYGGGAREPLLVTPDALAHQVGDEPLLVARASGAPVCVGRDRVAAARHLLDATPVDLILSDDGLQHYRLPRAFELCVVDGTRGLGNGRLLPVGPLREPAARLGEVDAVAINGHGPFRFPNAFHFELAPAAFVNLSSGARCAPESFDLNSAAACAGIGNPARFFNTLRQFGFAGETRVFADHHAYRAEDLAEFRQRRLVMTAKDAVKCAPFAGPDWWALEVAAQVPAALIERILMKLQLPG